MGMTLWGLLAGLLGAAALARVMSGLLFGVSAHDPITFAATILILSTVALGAIWVPARRATRVEPTSALRYE
jgi:ABC-type lipoprotein release transport system permease subunit